MQRVDSFPGREGTIGEEPRNKRRACLRGAGTYSTRSPGERSDSGERRPRMSLRSCGLRTAGVAALRYCEDGPNILETRPPRITYQQRPRCLRRTGGVSLAGPTDIHNEYFDQTSRSVLVLRGRQFAARHGRGRKEPLAEGR